MKARWGRKRVLLARLLLLAYLPSLAFLGHWEPRMDIPGTDLYIGVPVQPERGGHSHAGHGQHCHAESASCSDVPLTTSASVSLLADEFALDFPAGPLLTLHGAAWEPGETAPVAPESPPPRVSFAS